MSRKLTKLPTAATSYYRVMRAGRNWRVDLVTPRTNGRPLVTMLIRTADIDLAISYAQGVAESMQRPLRLPRKL